MTEARGAQHARSMATNGYDAVSQLLDSALHPQYRTAVLVAAGSQSCVSAV